MSSQFMCIYIIRLKCLTASMVKIPNIFSDLRKPGLVPGKSLSLAQNYVFCFGETLIYKNTHVCYKYCYCYV